MSMQVAREESAAVKRKAKISVAETADDEYVPELYELLHYTPANMRPGYLLLPEFSRIGGIRFEKTKDGKSKRKVVDDERLERMSGKIINTANAKINEEFAHTPWGFFCEEADIAKAPEHFAHCRRGAKFCNDFASEHKSDRHVRVELFSFRWDHTDEKFRLRLSEMIARKLMDIRAVYTTTNMGAFRVQMDRVRKMERTVLGEQSRLVEEALTSTLQQRKIMVAVYGGRVPRDWVDPRTGKLKAGIKLDFGPIDRAIKHFCPGWKPSADDSK